MNFNFNNFNFESCCVCLDDITEDNFVLCRESSTDNFKECVGCSECVLNLLENKWNVYAESVEKADCASALKKSVKFGPPINLRCYDLENVTDKVKEYHEFYLNKEIISAKLKGSLIGEEREKWIKEQNVILEYLESEEGKEMVKVDSTN
jgi:hypothetical protein